MSTYSGHVEPGGPAISRTATVGNAEIEIRKFSVGPMDNNVYLIRDSATDEVLVIDAANDADRILGEVEGLRVVGVVTTHGHGDHWQALAAVAKATGAPTWLHPRDADMVPHLADQAIDDGETIAVGSAAVQLLHTPGHTPGSTCLLIGDHLFTGDTLFPGGPGNTDGDPARFAEIMAGLDRLFDLPDDTRICPGHGVDSTIGRERPYVETWRARGW